MTEPSPRTADRIELIKAVWKSGMSASMIASKISSKDWGNKPTRNAIVGMFTRWQDRLYPCHLPAGYYSKQKLKLERRKLEPEPEQPPPPPPKPPPKRKKPPLKAMPVQRTNYELTEKSLRQYLQEQRMLERDRMNISKKIP